MEDRHMAQRIEQAEKELHLTKHRLSVLEQEQLPRRVASLEPVVKRLESKLDDIGIQLTDGLEEVKDAIAAQKGMQRGVVLTVAGVVGFIQLIPFLKDLLT